MPDARPRRQAVPVTAAAVLALALVLAMGGSVAAFGAATWPVQSLGDRGSDVGAIQALLRHHAAAAAPAPIPGVRRPIVGVFRPVVAAVDGIFGTPTHDAVRAFQVGQGLAATGIVDAATWARLVVPLAPGARGDAVAAVQRLLVAKRGVSLPIDGIYGSPTVAAVTVFQGHAGLPTTGKMDAATWRNLAWHFEYPTFSPAGLCDYAVGNGAADWATASTVAWTEAAGATMVGAGFGRVAVGDIGLEHGGDIAGHESHERGLDVDLRPMRVANDQCSWGTRHTATTYDRAATRALIRAIRSVAAGHVKLIYFNDPVLIGEGLATWYSGHDDHLHVRFCEAAHPVPAYDC